jgi:ribosomal-protein-alanine N-acetyltransferase
MKEILATERLIFSEINERDTEFIITLLNSPGWKKYIGDRHVFTETEAKAYIEKSFTKSYNENGFGFYKLILKSNFLPIGICGIVKRENLEHVDIGFALLPAYEGRGFAYEAAAAMMQYTTDKLGIKTIWAIALEENLSSIKLLHKLGMKEIKKIYWEASGEELLCFSNQF